MQIIQILHLHFLENRRDHVSNDGANKSNVSDRLVVRRRTSTSPINDDHCRVLIINQKLFNEELNPPGASIFQEAVSDEEEWMLFVDFSVEDFEGVVEVKGDGVFSMTREG